MMAHDTYHMLISLALDGELDQGDQTTLNQHLSTCHACSEMWTRMSILDTMFSSSVEVEPPINFTNQVMLRVGVYQQQRRWHPLVVAGLIGSSLASALTLALPIFFLSLGMDGIAVRWPFIGTLLGYLADAIGFIARGSIFFVRMLSGWLSFLFTDPAAMGVVLAALVMASIWIGVLESMKLTRLATQQAS